MIPVCCTTLSLKDDVGPLRDENEDGVRDQEEIDEEERKDDRIQLVDATQIKNDGDKLVGLGKISDASRKCCDGCSKGDVCKATPTATAECECQGESANFHDSDKHQTHLKDTLPPVIKVETSAEVAKMTPTAVLGNVDAMKARCLHAMDGRR